MATQQPALLVSVRFKSSLPTEELRRRYQERMPRFRELPGLLQKYYVYDAAGDEWGGVYLWDSQESFDQYRESELRRSIAQVYEVVGAPRVEVVQVADVLRDEKA